MPQSPLPAPIVLKQEFTRWMVDDQGYAPATRKSYLEKFSQAEAFMKATFGRRLIRVREEHVRAYLANFTHARTRNLHLTMLRTFFRFARERHYRAKDPTAELHRLPEPEDLPRPLTLAQAKRLRNAAAALGLRHLLIVDIGLYAGLRRAEIAGLRWSNIDLHGRRLRVFGKRRKERILPLHDEVIAELTLWRMTIPSDEWVFPSSQGGRRKHLSADTIGAAVKEAGIFAGVKVTTHPLRHTFATELFEKGSDIRRVQELLRHKSIASTQVYTQVSIGRLDEDIAKLDFGGSA